MSPQILVVALRGAQRSRAPESYCDPTWCQMSVPEHTDCVVHEQRADVEYSVSADFVHVDHVQHAIDHPVRTRDAVVWTEREIETTSEVERVSKAAPNSTTMQM
jgi:hypothetical protein